MLPCAASATLESPSQPRFSFCGGSKVGGVISVLPSGAGSALLVATGPVSGPAGAWVSSPPTSPATTTTTANVMARTPRTPRARGFDPRGRIRPPLQKDGSSGGNLADIYL